MKNPLVLPFKYFLVILFMLLYKVVLSFESVDRKFQSVRHHSDESYYTEQYFPVVLFIMLHNMVVFTFESADKILNCNNSNESYEVVFSSGAVYYATQGGSHF